MNNDILVIGSSNTDLIMKVKRLPKPGETVIGGETYKSLGGKGANQAVAAKRIGEGVTFICKLGNDIYGKEVVVQLQKEGIVTDYIEYDKRNSTGTAFILVDENGENAIAVASGANAELIPADIIKHSNVISKAKILLMQLEIPIESITEASRIAVENNVKVILNPAPARILDRELIKNISIITPNLQEASQITNIEIKNRADSIKAGKRMLDMGFETVIITQGKEGVLVMSEGIEVFLPSFEVDTIDTTGAGDVFNGVLAAYISKDYQLINAVKYASAAAAISVTKRGAQGSAPTFSELNKFLEERKVFTTTEAIK